MRPACSAWSDWGGGVLKVAFLTQVFDRADAVLGFVPRWVEGLARAADGVRVIALEVGRLGELPSNVAVREVGRKGSVRRYLRFRSALREALDQGCDAILAHMVPRYASLAAGPARRRGAKLFLWYTHGTVDQRLRRAERVVRRIFTASPESMRLETPKCMVTGHGIDLEHFDCRASVPDQPARILAVGRLTPAKDPLTIVAALSMLVGQGHDLHLDLVGGALASGDEGYTENLRAAIAQAGLTARVHLHGPVPYTDVPALYARASVCVNASLTGSLDKVVLEGMAAGRIVLSCNDAFPGLVRELGEEGAGLCFQRQGVSQLADRLRAVLQLGREERGALAGKLRAVVARDHEVDALMRRLVGLMDAEP